MNPLRDSLTEYLTFRRAFGLKLRGDEFALRSLVGFAEGCGQSHIDTDLVLAWTQRPSRAQGFTWAKRLSMVRNFATWLCTRDPDTRVPPRELFPQRYRRKPPYSFSRDDVERMVKQAATLPCPTGIRGMTYSTVLGLLANTGMRVHEAVRLNRDDVDLNEGVITVRESKFRKSRLVLLHATTCDALHACCEVRDRIHPRADTQAFFLSKKGRRITIPAVQYNFNLVCNKVGCIAHDTGRSRPHLHDLRHHFAVQTLIDWYRNGADVDRELPKLATFLGHAGVESTYWYLEAVPELLLAATKRLEAVCAEDEVSQ